MVGVYTIVYTNGGSIYYILLNGGNLSFTRQSTNLCNAIF